MSEKQMIKSSIIEISNKNKNIKEITMLVHKIDFVNGNGLDFKQTYVEKHMQSLVDMPVVCSYYEHQDDLGDHEPVFDENGKIIELRTIPIGTITEVWIDDYEINTETTVKALFAKATLWSYKYPKIISCIEKLYDSGECSSSVEVQIDAWGDNPTKSYRYATDYTYLANCLLGSTTKSADANAGIINIFQREIAIAAKEDLENIEIGESENNTEGGEMEVSTTEIFNKGFAVKYVGEISLNDLSFDDIRDQIYNLLNPIDPETESRTYKYWIKELYPNYALAEDWYATNTIYKIGYSVNEATVSVDSEDNWVKGTMKFVPDGVDVDALLAEKETAINNLTEEVQKLQGLVVLQKEGKNEYEVKIRELETEISELRPYKEKYEISEKQKQKEVLTNKYVKLMSKDTFDSERTQNAIERLDETELNSIVVEEVAKEKSNIEINNSTSESVVVTATQPTDLIPENMGQKYGFSV